MKKSVLLVILAALAISLIPARAATAANVSVSFFYDELSPYGRWSDVGSYGTCWIPGGVDAGWQPYSNGEWIYTDYGWTWVSDDRWGGDPYHYGTWVFEPPYGWVWVPGTVWAPAWVTWSYSDSYVGWAPIPPSLSISFGGYSGPAVVVSQTHYVFVPVNRFTGVRVSSVRLPVQQNSTYLRAGRRVTSYSVSRGVLVNRGPSVQRIESAAHTRIARVGIDRAKSAPRPISAGGVARGRKFSAVSPATVRARELKGRMAGNGGAPAGDHGRGAATAPRGGRDKGPAKRSETGPARRSEAPPSHGRSAHSSPPGEVRREEKAAPPPRTEHRGANPGREHPQGRRDTVSPAPPHAVPPPEAARERRPEPARAPEARTPSRGAPEKPRPQRAPPGHAPDHGRPEKPDKPKDDGNPHRVEL
jgi:uncharacterized protein DUF6600